jgi:hypothetical protein
MKWVWLHGGGSKRLVNAAAIAQFVEVRGKPPQWQVEMLSGEKFNLDQESFDKLSKLLEPLPPG